MTNNDELVTRVMGITTRQFNEATKLMKDALDDSNISTEDYAEVKCICRLMMSIAVQQKEERDFLFAQLLKSNNLSAEVKTP